MKGIIKAMDELPLILKVILALPALDIVWNIYRTLRSASKNNLVGIVLGLILIFVGWSFLWVVDIITLVLSKKVLWID